MTQPEARSTTTSPGWRRHALLLVKVVVTFGLLALILSNVDLGEVVVRASSANTAPLLLALGLMAAQVFLVAFRWSIVMRPWAQGPGIGKLISFTWEGAFYNLALPSGVGGDAIRMFRCSRAGMPVRLAVGGVILDRYTGVVALFFLCAVALAFPGHPLRTVVDPLGLVFLAVVLPFAALVPLVIDQVPGSWRTWPAVASALWLCQEARALFANLARVAIVMGLSAVNHLLTVLCFIAIGVAIGINAPIWLYMLLVPAAMVTTMIPLSLGGWGIREGAVVGLFSLAGVPPTEALTLSLLFGFLLLVIGLIGGVVGLTRSERAREPDLDKGGS